MKKSTKTALIIAIVLLLIGLIMLAGAAVASGGHFWQELENATSGKTSENYESQLYTVSQDQVQEICVDIVAQDIQVVSVPGDNISIYYYESENDGYHLSLSEDGRLNMKYWSKGFWQTYFHFDFPVGNVPLDTSINVVIELPETYGGSLDLSTVSGDLELADVTGRALTLSSTSGDLELSRTNGESLALTTTSGSIQISECEIDETVFCKNTSGDIQLRDSSAGQDSSFSCTSGDVELTDITIGGSLDVKTVSGEVDVDRLAAQTIHLVSTSGDISGSIEGALTDFSIESDTVSGDNSLPGNLQSGSKTLSVETISGDIDIKFTRN